MTASKKTNWAFLISLILITQGNLFLKPIGVILVILISNKFPLKVSKGSIAVFYMLMTLYAVANGVGLIWDFDSSYLFVVIMGISFWLLGLIIFQYLNYFVSETSSESIHSTLKTYFKINAFICLYQFVELLLLFDFVNPFDNQASGDFVRGFFANSSVNLIVCSFFLFYFFYRKDYALMAVAGILSLMTTYMSGILILFAVTGYFIFTSSRLRLAHRVLLLAVGVTFLVLVWVASRTNIIYAVETLDAISKEKKPRKIISFVQTYDFVTESPGNFLFGAGMGNFSSRLAFICSGEYVSWYPRDFLYRSKSFGQNHYSLWNANLIFDRTQRGTSNQPFSVYNQMLGEYGLIGFSILLVYYFGFYFRNFKFLTYGRVIMILLAGYFVLDYWFEFFSITIIAELMVLYNVKDRPQLASISQK